VLGHAGGFGGTRVRWWSVLGRRKQRAAQRFNKDDGHRFPSCLVVAETLSSTSSALNVDRECEYGPVRDSATSGTMHYTRVESKIVACQATRL
jgi:hypothetical protein